MEEEEGQREMEEERERGGQREMEEGEILIEVRSQ